MFGGFTSILQPATIGPPPKDVPPPTPIRFPQCKPQLPSSSGSGAASEARRLPSLVRFLQSLHRPQDLSESHFAALGVHVHTDVPPEGVVPDASYLPPSAGWDGIDVDQARRKDSTFRRPLCNGHLSPEARVYLERRNELSVKNQAAFRIVRRIGAKPGEQRPRLGNCYEFFRHMEMMASYWDDTSLPPLPEDDEEDEGQARDASSPPLPPRPHPHPIDVSLDQVGHALIAAGAESNTRAQSKPIPKPDIPERVSYRISPGNLMPPEFRHSFIAAFVKLVIYDFGCQVVPPRVEPRLHLLEPPPSTTRETTSAPSKQSSSTTIKDPKASYFPSGCVFLFRFASTRDAARAGIVEGPVAALSARNMTNFPTHVEANIDFGRELVAALVTAQHRAREDKVDKRFGEGKWWTTAKRWGGGEGGPIGREVEMDSVVGDKDANVSGPVATTSTESPPGLAASSSSSLSTTEKTPKQEKPQRPTSAIPVRGQPLNKRPRKNMSMYDNYRMIRLPISNWDKKTRYEAIGKVRGSGYDDVFVFSSLFHHFSVIRVRVPDRLLEVMGGAVEEEDEADREEGGAGGRSWGKLEVWRSTWFDLFVPAERLEAMRLMWGVVGWMMRKVDEGGDNGDHQTQLQGQQPEKGKKKAKEREKGDVVMKDA